MTLRSGACQYTISGLAAKSFPKLQIPFPEDTIQVKGINSLIRRTVFAANGDNIDYNRAGFSYVKISFRGGMATAEATDGSRMAVTASPHCADGDLDMILHEKALTVLDSIVKPDEELYVGIVGQVVVFHEGGPVFFHHAVYRKLSGSQQAAEQFSRELSGDHRRKTAV